MDKIFTEGDYIIISSGEYSSYGVGAIARALKSFTLDEARATPGCVTNVSRYLPTGNISIVGMIAAGFIEELPSFREIWTGDS